MPTPKSKEVRRNKRHRHSWQYGGECPSCGIYWEECKSYDCEKVKLNGEEIINP